MIAIIKANKLYFSLFLFSFVAGLVLLAMIQQGDIILYFSDHRSPWGDAFFRNFTKMGEEIIYLLAVLILIFYRLRYALMIPLVAVVVTLVSFGLKALFLHPRPSLYFKDQMDQINLVDNVHLLQGLTSFPSGHTMSGFAIYGILALMLPQKNKWLSALLFLMALLVGISRMYLVQHFLKDVLFGAFLGTLAALLLYYLQSLSPIKPTRLIDRGLWEIIKGKKNNPRA